MKNFIIASLVFASAFTIPVLAGNKNKSHKHESKDSKHEFREDHPVFGDGRLHPVHDDKVIGKFKNADKLKEKVAEIDEMDKKSLGEELDTINKEIDLKKEEIAKLRQERLKKILKQKDDLLKSKTELQLAQENPVLGLMNQIGLFANAIQLDQVERSEAKALEELKAGSEALEEKQLIQSYVTIKLI